MSQIIHFLLHYRYWLAAITVVLSIAVIFGVTRTSVDTSNDSILAENDPYADDIEAARAAFPPSTSVLFAFETDSDVFTMDALAAMDELTNRFTEIDSAVSIAAVTNRRLNEIDAERYDRDYLIPLLSTITEADLEDLKTQALQDEDLTQSLLSPDGTMALASLKYKLNIDSQERRLAVGRSVVAMRDELRAKYPTVNTYVFGGAVFELDSYNSQIKDSQTLFPITMVMGIGLLWFCLRSLPYAISLFAVAFAAVALTVGSWGWLDIPFNQTSGLGPIVVLVIAIAGGIHIVSVYAQGLHQNMSRMEAMRHSLAINLQPVTLATITTSMGFLSLNYSSASGIYDFGNIIALGTWWAYMGTLFLLPAIIMALPTNKVPKPLGVQTFIKTITGWVHTRENLLFWVSTAIVVGTFALLPLNKLDFDRFSFIDEDSDLHYVIKALREKIGNDQSLVYVINSGEYYGITEPEFLTAIDEMSQWIDSQPDTNFVTSYVQFLKALNKGEHDDDPAWEIIPTDKLQIIDYLVGYQLVQEIEPNLEPIFDTDYQSIRLIVGTSNLTNGELITLNERIEAWIESNLDPAYRVIHGDNSIRFARVQNAITLELAKGFTLSFILITLTLIVGLRSLRYGLLSIMPNLFPATIVFGFWGLFVGELSPYVLMLFSISIGIVVDDSVHILSKYITGLRDGKSPADAVTYSLDKAGSAITITTLSLAVGTFVLVFSNTFHFQNVALLLTPIIVVALFLDLLFLPPLLMKFDRWLAKRRSKATPA